MKILIEIPEEMRGSKPDELAEYVQKAANKKGLNCVEYYRIVNVMPILTVEVGGYHIMSRPKLSGSMLARIRMQAIIDRNGHLRKKRVDKE